MQCSQSFIFYLNLLSVIQSCKILEHLTYLKIYLIDFKQLCVIPKLALNSILIL